jgi:carbonic anhydrase/acetyltransferase-like protein (isoleucine patch superfamily)
MNLVDKKPSVAKDAFVAPNASLVGDIQVGSKSSIWYNCVLRGDTNSIRVGSETNIQDHSLVSVGGSRSAPTVLGNKVTVGHGAVLHACTVEDEAFVGMGATLLDGVVVERGAFVAAGAMVTENTRIPAGQIWAGNPAKFLRNLKGNEGAFIPKSADYYSELGAAHAGANTKSFHDLTTVQVKSEEQCPTELTAETAPAA